MLELKKLLFYEWSSEVGGIAFCERFRSKIKSVIIKEKVIAQTNDRFPAFNEKWDTFTAFYDFRGRICKYIVSHIMCTAGCSS